MAALASLKRFAQPGQVIDSRTDRRDIEQLCETGKAFLAEQVKVLAMRRNPSLPMIRFYCSDGTPLLLNRQWAKMLNGKTFYRRAKSSQEYIVEMTYFGGVDEKGMPLTAVQFRDPFPLASKSSWDVFACCLSAAPSIRALGHTEAALSMYVFDRAIYGPMDRMAKQFHERQAQLSVSPTAEMDRLLDFAFSRGDVLHDTTNGFHWCMKPHLPDNVSTDMFIAISSLRNSYDILMENCMSWLPTVARFAEPPVSKAVLEELWTCLGVEPEVIEMMVDNHIIFMDGVL